MQEHVRQVKTETKESGKIIAARVMDVLFVIVEILLGFRLIFKLFGANPDNGFVHLMYRVTAPLTALFEGIFNQVSLGGENPERVLEPETLIALVVVAIIAWVIHRLIYPNMKKEHEQTQVIRTAQSTRSDQSIDK